MTEANRVVLTEDPNDTYTQYLVYYGTGAVTCDVHEMITRRMADGDLEPPHKIDGIWLIVNDNVAPIRVDVIDRSDGQGLEWEIVEPGSPGARPSEADVLLEYVLYEDDDHAEFKSDEVFVWALPAPPSYPQMAFADD